MNAVMGRTRGVEAEGKAMLLPLLNVLVRGAELTDTDAMPNRVEMQRTYGDYVFYRGGAMLGVEVKAERRWTGNLFVEVFSNATVRRGMLKLGWIATLGSAGLVYGFLDRRCAVVCELPKFRQWFEANEVKYGLVDVERSKTGEQRNRTVGCKVPVKDLDRAWCRLWMERDGAWGPCELADIEQRGA